MDHFKKEKQLSGFTKELIDANENLKLFAKAVAHDLRSPAVHIEEMVKLYQKKYTEKSSPKQLEILGFIKDGLAEKHISKNAYENIMHCNAERILAL
mgnify:CR=1 FL=1